MKKIMLLSLMSLSFSSMAEKDIVLPGERWEAKFSGHLCVAYGDKVSAPSVYQQMNVNFETITTDYTLDNGLIKATFEEEGSVCRYSALLLADNDASTIGLVRSKAYAVKGSSDCQEGKAVLDEHLKDNDYLYWGHPHHLTILVPALDAGQVCGDDATHVGADFIVSRFLGEK